MDLILIHLAFANTTILCTKDITTFFHLRNSLGDAGCETALYPGSAAHGLSVCSACLLGVVQAISSRGSSNHRLHASASQSAPLRDLQFPEKLQLALLHHGRGQSEHIWDSSI